MKGRGSAEIDRAIGTSSHHGTGMQGVFQLGEIVGEGGSFSLLRYFFLEDVP